jgi:glycosyltransferase involved in cell wall biosynthesis
MRIGLVAPPFIPVPPSAYGGTELFVEHLARGLLAAGHRVVLYANGESRTRAELRWRYPCAEWPIVDQAAAQLKQADHAGWAIHDARRSVDLIHTNDIAALPFTRFVDRPFVHTLHHPYEASLSAQYLRYPAVHYVAISQFQADREPMPGISVVHHGIDLSDYTFSAQKGDYVLFLGRMAPAKGAHLAIEAARRAGVHLKLAGEVQPIFQDYWDAQVLPRIDGRTVEYVGPADQAFKKELLAYARALLFPIQWDEPFGLVMIEAMACGTPVLALPGGSVAEVVKDGTSGWVCRDIAEMADRATAPDVPAESCRAWVAERFSLPRMVDRYIQIYARAASADPPSSE